MSTSANTDPPTTATPAPGVTKPPRTELGLRKVFREPAERFEVEVFKGTALVQHGEETLDEAPAWAPGRRFVWLARLWTLMSSLVAAVTFGRVRTGPTSSPGTPGGRTLREQIVGERLPALRRAIRAIRRLRRPINTRTLRRELSRVTNLRMATWLSWRGIRLRLYLLTLVVWIILAWVWANREALLFYGVLIAAGVLFIVMIAWVQQNWSWIADELRTLLDMQLIPEGP